MTITARRAATRTRLLDAAMQVFVRRGVVAASVEEICEEAGFTRGAFYSNFESKDDLCLALLRAHQDAIAGSAAEVLSNTALGMSTNRGTLNAIVQDVLGPFLADTQMLLVLTDLKLYAVRNPDVRAGYQAADCTLSESLLSLIGHVLSDQDLEFSVSGQQVLTMLEGATTQITLDWLSRGETPDLTKTSAQVTELLAHFIVRKLPDGSTRRLADDPGFAH